MNGKKLVTAWACSPPVQNSCGQLHSDLHALCWELLVLPSGSGLSYLVVQSFKAFYIISVVYYQIPAAFPSNLACSPGTESFITELLQLFLLATGVYLMAILRKLGSAAMDWLACNVFVLARNEFLLFSLQLFLVLNLLHLIVCFSSLSNSKLHTQRTSHFAKCLKNR